MDENTPKKMERWRQHLTRYGNLERLLNGVHQRGHIRAYAIDQYSFKLSASETFDIQPAELTELQELGATPRSKEALFKMLTDMVEHSRSESVRESRKVHLADINIAFSRFSCRVSAPLH